MKLCLATAIQNFMSVKITHICLGLHQTFANLDVWTLISFPINYAAKNNYYHRI